MIRPALHILMHILVPGIAAKLVYKDRFRRAWLIMLLTMIIDLDHLLAVNVYDPMRCSIGFHPLHSHVAILIYVGLAMLKKTRIAGMGLLIHMVLDGLDCIWIYL